ncbi:MAG: 30S ribosomal protein S5 [bacterium]|nr:30S ribosomal protein S5 [bacterium]
MQNRGGGGPGGGPNGGGGDRGRRRPDHVDEAPQEFEEAVIYINRVSKVVKGGRKFNFTALVAVGDKKNRVGLGYGKAAEVVDAIKKGVDDAKRNMIVVSKNGTTIPYEITTHVCASTIRMRPAKKGHGIIAGGPARAILHLAGYEDISAKFYGSSRPINCARVTFTALQKMVTPEYIKRLRSGEKLDAAGRFASDVRRQAAEAAIEQFSSEQAAEEAGPATSETATAQE